MNHLRTPLLFASTLLFVFGWMASVSADDTQDLLLAINSNDPVIYEPAILTLAKAGEPALVQATPYLKQNNDFGKTIAVLEHHGLSELLPLEWPVIKANEGAEKRVLLVTGHEYPGHLWQETAPALAGILARDNRLEVSYTEDPRILAQPMLDAYDAIFLNYQNHQVPAPQGAFEQLRTVVEGGKGLVLFHFASGAFIDWETGLLNSDYADLAGRAWNPHLPGHDPRGPFRVHLSDTRHPITHGITDFDTDDELYTCLDGSAEITVLAQATSILDGQDHPMAFVHTPGKGRVFHSPLGHDLKALNDQVARLYLHGTLWAAGLTP